LATEKDVDPSETPLRRHADTVVAFGYGSAALCFGDFG
jgi:hypothetical protein